MRTEQRTWTPGNGWSEKPTRDAQPPSLVLLFGSTAALEDPRAWDAVRSAYPGDHAVGCSTAGEILDGGTTEGTVAITAIWFDHTRVVVRSVEVEPGSSSRTHGAELAAKLPQDELAHVLVFSDGLIVNGSELVAGMTSGLPQGVAVTGGLAGDGARFDHTLVAADAPPRRGLVAAIGLYGNRLKVGYGSLGGWDPFGPERLITRADANVLYELDHQPALSLYKRYLGEHSASLPSSGLLFPLSVRTDDGHSFVRTILAVSEEHQSLTFAGDMPPGAYARLMKANFDRLVDGASGAATTSVAALGVQEPQLALLISCVGRRLVLGQRTDDEVQAVRDVVGPGARLAGFYSYGEICPAAPNANCELHNQTMTITVFREE